MAGGGAAQVPDGNAGDNGNAPLVCNDLLSFVAQKFNYMPTDSIVQLCVQFYGEEAIDAANLLVGYTSAVPTAMTRPSGIDAGRARRRRRRQWRTRCDALTVTFVAVDLATNLPPVSFDSPDVCALLARADSTKAEMDLMKQSEYDERCHNSSGFSM